jgi:hypothetical protein
MAFPPVFTASWLGPAMQVGDAFTVEHADDLWVHWPGPFCLSDPP